MYIYIFPCDVTSLPSYTSCFFSLCDWWLYLSPSQSPLWPQKSHLYILPSYWPFNFLLHQLQRIHFHTMYKYLTKEMCHSEVGFEVSKIYQVQSLFLSLSLPLSFSLFSPMDLVQLIFNLATGSCSSRISVVDWVGIISQAHMFQCMVHLGMALFRRIGRYGLVKEGMALLEPVCHWGWVLEFCKLKPGPAAITVILLPDNAAVELSTAFPAPCLPVCCHAPCKRENTQNLRNCR